MGRNDKVKDNKLLFIKYEATLTTGLQGKLQSFFLSIKDTFPRCPNHIWADCYNRMKDNCKGSF